MGKPGYNKDLDDNEEDQSTYWRISSSPKSFCLTSRAILVDGSHCLKAMTFALTSLAMKIMYYFSTLESWWVVTGDSTWNIGSTCETAR